MVRRVHLHIGTMKSATTYIQELCELHLDHLAKRGVLWPRGIVKYAAVRDLFGRAAVQTDPPDAWRSLEARIRDHEGDLVLSNELLATLPSDEVGRLVGPLHRQRSTWSSRGVISPGGSRPPGRPQSGTEPRPMPGVSSPARSAQSRH